ncbi:hypothetical protein AVW09_04060 [Microbacterium sp. T32]|nr:hypothetical protein AVW09_04060 [Microbacterium sp. T32]
MGEGESSGREHPDDHAVFRCLQPVTDEGGELRHPCLRPPRRAPVIEQDDVDAAQTRLHRGIRDPVSVQPTGAVAVAEAPLDGARLPSVLVRDRTGTDDAFQ